ncbi:MAG: alpha-2-macroglobulin family protein [Cyclobacteriaceae bacterium]|nr:alpha-2-macroglobulin family protein [Cyclobacteriaceae bacterium]
MGVSVTSQGGNLQNQTIQIRGISTVQGGNNPLYIINGQVFTGDMAELRAEDIEKMEILKGDEAMAIYGAKAINGVILITTKKGIVFMPNGIAPTATESSDDLLAGFDPEANAIRNNFSDYGFWEPHLVTDEKGTVRFPVTFPDDVTKWQTFVIGMNGKRQAGIHEGAVRSFKPLMAQLAMPRFMVAGDSISGIGKILNYTPDSVSLFRSFEINDSLVFSKNEPVGRSAIDSLHFTTNRTDSLRLKYFLKRDDGYLDGEERYVPVVPLGMEESVGVFMALNRDTTVSLTFDPQLGDVNFYAQADVVDVLEQEINYVLYYVYNCNEQLASKLKLLIAQRNIDSFRGINSTKHDREIGRFINQLIKNQNDEGIWGWWSDTGTNMWITIHVMEALLQAKWYGYSVNIREQSIFDHLFWQLQSKATLDEKLALLRLFRLANMKIDYGQHIGDMAKAPFKSVTQYMKFLELKRYCGFETKTDTI